MAPATTPEEASAAADTAAPAETAFADEQASEVNVLSALEQRFSDDVSDPAGTDEEPAEETKETETEEEPEEDPDPEVEDDQEEPESDDDPDEETEEDESEDEDPEEEEPAKRFSLKSLPKEAQKEVQRIIDKRVGKAVHQLKEAKATATQAEERAKSLETQINQLAAEKVVPAPTRNQPLSMMTSDDALNQLEQDSWEFKQWAIQNPQGGECPLFKDKDGNPVELNAEKTRSMLAIVEADLGRSIPQRRAFLRTDAEYSKVAMQAFPDLKDPNSELSMAVNGVLRAVPELKAIPGHKLGAAYYEIGRRIFEKHQTQTWAVVQRLLSQKPATNGQRIKPKQEKVKPKPVPAARRPAPTSQRPAVRAGSDANIEDVLASRIGI